MMIEKRYLMVLSVAIVSVLLGSLFYNNITQAQKTHTYRDSVKLVVLEWTGSAYYIYGIHLDNKISKDFPYVFTPEESFLRISNIWLTVMASSSYGVAPSPVTFNVTFNGLANVLIDIVVTAYKLGEISVNIEDSDILQVIHPGVNTLKLSDTTDDLVLYGIYLFIEYEYQAR